MNKRHGHKTKKGASKIYRLHHNIVQRCSRPSCTAFKDYGARGIGLHPPWFDFSVFVAEIPLCPDPALTLDRIDNNKGYVPGNIKWSDRQEQANNKRNNKMIHYRGETKSLAQWCRELDVNYMTVKTRLRNGWTVSKALTTPTGALAIRRAHAKNSKKG